MRTIFHLTSHTYRGIKISPEGLGYGAKVGNVWLFGSYWWQVENMIDEIKAKSKLKK